MAKKILQVDKKIFDGVVERIHLPDDPPNIVVIAGPCRSGTTALGNVFAHAGYISYMQPIKSILRALDEGGNVPEFIIKNTKGTVVSKETFGAKSESEYFDPVDILIRSGYPKEKIHLIAMMREPSATLTSWTWMWEEVLVDGFIRAYRQTMEVLNNARLAGVNVTSYVHEAIRDNDSAIVVGKLFKRLFGRHRISGNSVDWVGSPNFDKDEKVKFFDEPPERFVHAVKTWGAYEFRALKPELTVEQHTKLRKEGILNVYNDFLRQCEADLDIKIRIKFDDMKGEFDLETKDTNF